MEDTIVEEKMKKSAFTAKAEFDYQRLIFAEPYLLPLKLTEEKEELTFFYDLGQYKSFNNVRAEDRLTILAVLMNVETLQDGLLKYCFSLHPNNLYYDENRIIRVKIRDIYPAGHTYQEEEFMADYCALCSFALQQRYSFDDIRQGGKRLTAKDPFMGQIILAEKPQEIKAILYKEYQRIEKEQKEKKMLLGKKTYFTMITVIIILAVLCLGGGGYAGYSLLREKPYQRAIISAGNAYIETDYVECIDALKEIKAADLEQPQKYILANAYVRGENLSQEQKNNILSNLSMQTAPARLEYWIYLGRGDTDQAVDIAMQQSDDQLLLYAYMKTKAAVESSTDLSGAEKTEQLNDLNSKMEPLMKQYESTSEGQE